MNTREELDWEALYLEQADRLWRAILAYTGDPALTDDAVAEAFAQLLRRGGAVRSPEAWIWTAAFRIARGELRARGGPSGVRAEEPVVELPEPAWDLLAMLRRLSERQRAVIVLHYYVDRPVSDIARILGCSSSTVRVQLTRGRRRLRELLEAQDD